MAMPQYNALPTAGQPLAFDSRSLDSLKHEVTREGGPKSEQQKEVARQFEALFLQMMIKRMREATPRDGMFDSDQTRLAQTMADEQLALELASPGIGLAQAILQQIRANQGGAPDAALDSAPLLAPEVNNSRLPGLVSRLGVDTSQGPNVRGDVAAMIDRLSRGGRPAETEPVKPPSGAPSHVVDFVNRMAEPARRAANASGVPARLILGQAALESGWGRREILHSDGRPSYNVFGIKATGGWTGKVAEVVTTEYVDGKPQKMVQAFRAYGSYEEAFSDYARLIGNSPRYERVTQARNEVEAAWRIQQAGYATDPNYADKLIGVMGQFGGSV